MLKVTQSNPFRITLARENTTASPTKGCNMVKVVILQDNAIRNKIVVVMS
jgi:hypothetical protein